MAFVPAAASPAFAPAGGPVPGTGEIRGRVLRAPDRAPLPGILIVVSPARPAVRSGPDGAFVVPSLPAGRYALTVAGPGFAGAEIAVDLGPGQAAEVEVVLEPTRLTLHEEITVTAERGPEAVFDSPAAVDALDARALAAEGARTAPEMLPESSGVWLQKTNHGAGSPFLRGLTGNQVLALVDGIRLNNSTYRYGPNQYLNTVDAFSLDRVEVLRGAGSTLYGSDAVGGVLQFLTPAPGFSSGGTEIRPSVRLKASSAGQEATGRFDLSVATPGVAFAGGVSLRTFGDLRAGGGLGVESPSGYKEMAADIKGLFRLGRAVLVTAAWQYVRQPEVPAYDQVAQRGYERYAFTPQERRLGYLRAAAYSSRPLWREVEATVSWQGSVEGREKRKEGSVWLTREEDRVGTLGLQFQVRGAPAPGWRLTTGVELYADRVRSQAEDVETGTGETVVKRGLYPDGARALNLAVYHAQSLDAGRLGLRAGLRGNFVRVKTRDALFGDIDIAPAALVGHASVLWRLGGRFHAVINLGRSFRAPNVNDLSSFGAFDYGIEVPAPGLRPEYGTTVEAGAKYRGGRGAWAVYLYSTRLEDLIVRVASTYLGSPYIGDDRVYRKANAQSAYVRGVEAESQLEAGRRWRVTAWAVYAFGHNVSDDEPLRRIPPFNGRLGLEYAAGGALSLSAAWTFAAGQTRLSAGDIADHRIGPDGTPGWHVVDVLARWRRGALGLSAGIRNLFDAAYRTHGSGIDGPGRQAWIALAWGI